MANTISFSEKANQGRGGWTSFHSWLPDWMCSLNNRFFSIKDGQLYMHNDLDNPVRNNFYKQQYGSKVVPIFNDANGDDKIFKTLVQEGSHPWAANLRTNMTQGHISNSEFNKRESRFFAYIRKNENDNDLHGHTAQGIGVIATVAANIISFSMLPNMVSVGDELYQVNGSAQELIGEISDISSSELIVSAIITTPIPGLFAYAKKNARVEGSEMRGHFLEVELSNNDAVQVELFAVSTNAVKSFV